MHGATGRAPLGRLFRGPLVGERSPSNALASAASGPAETSTAAAAVAATALRSPSRGPGVASTRSSLELAAETATERRAFFARGAADARTLTTVDAHVDIIALGTEVRTRAACFGPSDASGEVCVSIHNGTRNNEIRKIATHGGRPMSDRPRRPSPAF